MCTFSKDISIIEETMNYICRIMPSDKETKNYVLGRFGKSELELITPLIEKGAKASKSLATAKEIDRVIEKYNRKD